MDIADGTEIKILYYNDAVYAVVCVCFIGMFTKLRKATVSFIMSVFPPVHPSVRPSALNNESPTGKILTKFGI